MPLGTNTSSPGRPAMLTPAASPPTQPLPAIVGRLAIDDACLWERRYRARRRKLAVRLLRRRRHRYRQQQRRKVEAAACRLLHGSAWTLLGAAEKQKIVRHVREGTRRLSLGQVLDGTIAARRLVLAAFEAHIRLFHFDDQANESLPHELLELGLEE